MFLACKSCHLNLSILSQLFAAFGKLNLLQQTDIDLLELTIFAPVKTFTRTACQKQDVQLCAQRCFCFSSYLL